MSSKLGRKSVGALRGAMIGSAGQNRSRSQQVAAPTKKTVLQPMPPKVNNQNSSDTEAQPISDFPSPPVQIVSCRHGQGADMVQLPELATAPRGEVPQLAFQKLKQCNRICDFSDPNADLRSKETKNATLDELIDCYRNPRIFARLTRECHQALIEMFATNVFRPPPNVPRALLLSDEVTIEDTAWPHLRRVYILFLRFLECQVDPRILQFQLTPKFISNLFAVLDFPDERERLQARTVIATIFNKVPPQRPLLRIITSNLLMDVPEGLELNAASHLLELFYLFAEGIHPPLTPPVLTAFDRVLLPLHLPCRCQRYFDPLVKCILLMVSKDARLGNSLLRFLISHWPLTQDHKSELFISEVTQMLEVTNTDCLNENIRDLLSCIAIAAESPGMNLANKALNFMLNNRIQNIIAGNPEPLLNIIFPALFRVARGHWEKSVQLKALTVMNTLMELNPSVFRKVAEEFKQVSLMERARKRQKKSLWDAVAQVAAKNDLTLDTGSISQELTAFYGVGSGSTVRPFRGKRQSQPLIVAPSKSDMSKSSLPPLIPGLSTSQTFRGAPVPSPPKKKPLLPVCHEDDSGLPPRPPLPGMTAISEESEAPVRFPPLIVDTPMFEAISEADEAPAPEAKGPAPILESVEENPPAIPEEAEDQVEEEYVEYVEEEEEEEEAQEGALEQTQEAPAEQAQEGIQEQGQEGIQEQGHREEEDTFGEAPVQLPQ